MNASESSSAPAFSLTPRDILFILSRHKFKIAILTLLGLGAAAALYFLTPAVYQSQAKLLVRYLVERSAIDSLDAESGTSSMRNSEAVISAEVEILTSWDLAEEVAEAVGIDKLAPDLPQAQRKSAATTAVIQSLGVAAGRGSNVMVVSYRSEDPELAENVLRELVNRYFTKHLEVHRSIGAFDFVTQQTDQVRGRLRQTEDELTKLKTGAGILSLSDSTTSVSARLARSQQELLAAETEFAEQEARVKALAVSINPGSADEGNPSHENPAPDGEMAGSGEIQEYSVLMARLGQLRSQELELLARYSPGNSLVKSTRTQIEKLGQQRQNLEEKFPSLRSSVSQSALGEGPRIDLVAERARLAAAAAKIKILNSQLVEIQENAGKLAAVGTQIASLERRKDVEETNYKYFESSLEKARIDEALDPSKIPNISVVQKPSRPVRVQGELKKPVTMLAAGGLGLGVALAFLIELVLNRSVRRPVELEAQLRIPLLISIPYFSTKSRSRMRLKNKEHGGAENTKALQKAPNPNLAPWATDHFIRSASEELRDRLILWFQLKNLTHKPKLVGIAGVDGGEGSSTLAGGLAAALSETGDGKVLLVDMNSGHSDAHPFVNGESAFGLTQALEPDRDVPPTAENLYLATGAAQGGGPIQLAPKRFYALMPHLKASQFDYIIFDLPPVSRNSATLAMAGCLDKMLLVVEAEKSDREKVTRTYSELVNARAQVSAVLNKLQASDPGSMLPAA